MEETTYELVSNNTVVETPAIVAAPVEATTAAPAPAPATEAPVAATPAEQPPAQQPAPVAQVAEPTPQPTPQAPSTPPIPSLSPEEEKILQAWKTGSLKDYVRVSSTDYDTMPDKSVLRTQFDKQYPFMSAEDRDDLFNYELATKYQQTGDETADRVALLKMKADAGAARSTLKQEQSLFTIPEYKQPEAVAPDPETLRQQQEAQAQYDRTVQMFTNHPELAAIEANRVLKLGTGDESLNYELPTGIDVRGATLDTNKFLEKFWTPDQSGQQQFNMQKWAKVVAVASDPDAYEKALISYGKTLGEKKSFDELRNPDRGNAPGGPVPSQTPMYELVR